MSPRGGVAVLAAVVLGICGCTTPEGSPAAYRAEAASTLDAAQSHMGTARLALRAVLAGMMPGTSADDTVTTAEVALDSLASSFAALQPPRGADGLREAAGDALSAAQNAMAEARIVTRRGDPAGERRALVRVEAAEQKLAKQRESWS